MVDYSQFEASTKSGIHADVNRIRKKDEIIRAVVSKYHSSFQPHPLYWGIMDQQAIGEALRQVEEDNRENSKDEWEVLKEIAQKFPDLGNGNMILLDENYVPFGKKNYMDGNYQALNQQGEPF